MGAAGIVCEYNPFHRGHAWHIAETRRRLGADTAVVCVMSGHWTQQAGCAIADKWLRARLALMGGADLVLELPTVWAAASAETFARGAVELLAATGVVDALSFGSECGDAEALGRAAACLDAPEYPALLRAGLEKGRSFAASRQAAVEALAGPETGALLRGPNNNLGVEYLRALHGLGSPIAPITVLRRGAEHNSLSVTDGLAQTCPGGTDPSRFASATGIRRLLLEGKWDQAEPFLLPGARMRLEEDPAGLAVGSRMERVFLARLRTMTAEDWAALPDSGAAEGLPDRLVRAGRACSSVEEFFDLAKTRRYPHARLRRLALWALLGLTAADRPARPPYLRVLGMNGIGQGLLRAMKEQSSLPVLTKPAHARQLPPEGRRLFEQEVRSTDLYGLCFPQPRPCGLEWTRTPVVLE